MTQTQQRKTYTNEKFKKLTTMSMKHKPKIKMNNSFLVQVMETNTKKEDILLNDVKEFWNKDNNSILCGKSGK